MVLYKLKLENFGIYKELELDFHQNINLISSGIENGQGKSTIRDAILLLIYNKIKNKLADYINWNSDYFKIS